MRAILVGIWNRELDKDRARESIRELEGLVEAVEGKALGYILQRKERPDPRYFIGEGKAREIGEIAKGTEADTVVFDDFLTPSQVSNLEKLMGIRVVDRNDLAIEIFSRRARTREAKLQVELARLTHELPRLQGKGKKLSRLGGGVGTRGPGEQETEVRRRDIKRKIHRIKEEIEELKQRRRQQRKRRERPEGSQRVLKVALVGYTNAGKSTLMKVLTGREVFTADMPFATLDTRTSPRYVSEDLKILFTDTVGFIRKLSPELIESFKATLEEVSEADLLLHVVDASSPDWLEQVESVNLVLKELSADDKPVIYALNKIDRIFKEEGEIKYMPHTALLDSRAVPVSAIKGWGIDRLIKAIEEEGKRVLELEAV